MPFRAGTARSSPALCTPPGGPKPASKLWLQILPSGVAAEQRMTCCSLQISSYPLIRSSGCRSHRGTEDRRPAPRPHRRWRGDGEAASHRRGKSRHTHAHICLFCEARQAAGHHAGSDFVSSCRHQKTGEAIGWRERRVGAAAKVRWRRSSVLAREEPGGVASARATRGTRTRESAACRRNGGGGSKSRG
jgi:hypothetical protein